MSKDKFISQTSINIETPELRDAQINIKLIQRKLMSQFSSKRDCIVQNIYLIFHCFYIVHIKNCIIKIIL